jgi:signal transduction histidine kinase
VSAASGFRLRSTLRLRLTLVYAGLFFAAGLVLLGVTYVLVERELPKATGLFTGRLADPQNRPGGAAPSGLPGDALAAGPDDPFLRTSDGDVLTAEEASDYLADRQAEVRRAALTSLLTRGGAALLLVGSAAVGFGWLIAGRVLAPLHRVTETARRIAHARAADRSLHERIDLRGPHDEVKELADTFDSMVERLDKSFDGQRRFVSNASHELRTPLTLNRALVEVAMHRKGASGDVKQLGETLLEINVRHERLIDGLLLLARSDAEIGERAPVDLADVVTHVVAQAGPEARRAGVTIKEEPDEAYTVGDPVLLEHLVRNLVENGIRHNAPSDGSVRVTSRCRPDRRVELEVSNTGPVVPAYNVPALFEPFHRFGTDRLVTAKGVGLGLSIVESISRAHAAEVTAAPRDGGGLVVTVILPGYPESGAPPAPR